MRGCSEVWWPTWGGPDEVEPGGPADALSSHPLEPAIAIAMTRLIQISSDERDWRILGEAALREVYYRLLLGSAGPLLRARLGHSGALPQVARAIRFIEENLADPMDVTQLARVAGLSSSGLHEKFRRVTAQSPMQFVKGLRLDRARSLIAGGTGVTEAAMEVGYQSPSQFSREFKRRYGFSPSKAARMVGAAQAAQPKLWNLQGARDVDGVSPYSICRTEKLCAPTVSQGKPPPTCEERMKLKVLEFVTPNVDAVCATYSSLYDVTFSGPIPELGNVRVADLPDGGRLGVRGPMRPDETPVVRPYLLVDDVAGALAAAKEAGAEIAVPAMEIPGQGTIGIFIQGGIENGLWQRE